MDTIKIFNNLCIGPCDVTKLNETAYLLPKRKHPTLYSNRDEQMEDERERFPADQYMRVNEKTVNRNRSKQCKRGRRKHIQKNLAIKTKYVRLYRQVHNNADKKTNRCYRRGQKQCRMARIAKKTLSRSDMKNLNKSLVSFTL